MRDGGEMFHFKNVNEAKAQNSASDISVSLISSSHGHGFLHWRNQELRFSERLDAAQVVSPENLIDKVRFLLVTCTLAVSHLSQ